MNVDGKRLLVLTLVAAVALWLLARLERPERRMAAPSGIDLQELLLDGVAF